MAKFPKGAITKTCIDLTVFKQQQGVYKIILRATVTDLKSKYDTQSKKRLKTHDELRVHKSVVSLSV